MTKSINKFYSFLPSLFSPRGRGQKRTLFTLAMIILLVTFLRFYKLGQIPPSLDWDEVSLAYNAESLMQTGRDEFGHSWPLSIQSFSDYKPPVYTYLLIPVLKIFGKTEFAVRFPSALAGTLTVLVTYFLTLELFEGNQRKNGSEHSEYSESQKFGLSDSRKVRLSGAPSFPNNIAIIAALLLAISPWHLQFSRIAFEANVGLLFFVTGMWLLIRALHQNSQWSMFFSVVSISAAMMSYHSLRVVVPLLVFTILFIYRRELLALLRCNLASARLHLYREPMLPLILSAFLSLLTILTISYIVFFQKVGQSRFEKTSFLTIDNLLTISRDRLEKYGKNPVDKVINIKYFIYAKQYIKGYLDHFDLRFWFLDGDRIDRHRAPGVGLLYWWELPFLFMGLMSLIGPVRPMAAKEKAVLFLWLMLAPAASALTGGTPSAVRSLVFLPTFQIFTALGIIETAQNIKTRSVIQKRVFGLLLAVYCLLLTVEITHYFHQYYIHFPLEYAPAWQYGYRQMVEKVMAEKNDYEKIVVTTSYDQPYIYFLWYGNYDPKIWVNNGEFNKRFDKYEFRKIVWDKFSDQQRILVISSPDETKGKPVKWQINYPDGKTAFNATEL